MVNQVAVAFIKAREQCRLTAYNDRVDGTGTWTVGWGSTGPDVVRGVVWSQDQADSRLALDVDRVTAGVRRLVRVNLTGGQEAALISFAYNVGVGGFTSSGLLSAVNGRDWCGAAKAFANWDHQGAVEVRGLLVRRLEEAVLFLTSTP